MADKRPDEVALRQAWRPLSHRFAVATGSFVALVSLFHHVPVSTAALRGAGTYAAILLVARLGLWAMETTLQLEKPHDTAEEER